MKLPSLDIITGPMFSGKSTELLRRLNIYSELGFSTLYINSNLDSRSDKNFSTHNPIIKSIGKISSVKLDSDLTMEDINKKIDFNNFKVIGIDEAQMFYNLKRFVIELIENYDKKVIVVGLNGDYERNKFGEILDLIPICDKLTKLNSVCSLCSKNKGKLVEAPFTKRIGDSKEKILIGGNASYHACCRKCYFN